MPRVAERGRNSGPGGSRRIGGLDARDAGVERPDGERARGGAVAARRGVAGGVGCGVRFGVAFVIFTRGTSGSWAAGDSTEMETEDEDVEEEPELEELLDAGVG